MGTLGRTMQGLGLIVPPAAMVLQIAGGLSVKQLLVALLFGVALFYLGRMVEGYARK